MSQASPDRPEPVAFSDRYYLTQLLAVGGMAEIYLGYLQGAMGLSMPVVVKRLKPELAADRRAAQMFIDEARLATILSHPHVVQGFDVGEEDGTPFIVMEYIRGEELNQLARRGLQVGYFMPEHLAVEVVRQAAIGLGYCHSALDDAGGELELVHCDISPNNLLITEDGFVKIIDFGIAQYVSQQHIGRAAVPGKLSYMSPEQARGERLDQRSDLFSLGIILYEMTTGRRLFRGPAAEVRERLMSADIPLPTFVDQSYPGYLEGIVMRCLELNPEDRFQTGFELAGELAGYLVASGRPVGSVELARYLDELAEAAGSWPRQQRFAGADDTEELDFDRATSEQPPISPAGDIGVWDELDEADGAVAAALGIDVGLVRRHGSARGITGDASIIGRVARSVDAGDEPVHDGDDAPTEESSAPRVAASSDEAPTEETPAVDDAPTDADQNIHESAADPDIGS